jgi:signal transduction histidine kinase
VSKEKDDTLFTIENSILENAQQVCEDDSYRENELLENYKGLTKNYRKLLRQTSKLLKISDSQEKYLNESNEKLEKLTQELSLTNEKLVRETKFKSDFLANLSHDLRTPLNVVLGIVQSLLFGVYEKIDDFVIINESIRSILADPGAMESLDDETRAIMNVIHTVIEEQGDESFPDIVSGVLKEEYRRLDAIKQPGENILRLKDLLLELVSLREEETGEHTEAYRKIESSSNYLLTLIDDILNISRVEAGKYIIKKVQMDIKVFLKEVYNLSIEYARCKDKLNSIEIHMDLGQLTIENAVLDPKVIQQCILNVMSNAIKFTFDGYILLKVHNDDDTIYFNIEDTGIGIRREDFHKIFKEYERIPNADNIEGTGLGLSYTKKLIELHGGAIQFVSHIGKGSKFILQIPIDT